MNISFDFKEFKWIQAFLRTFDNKGTEIRIQKLLFSEDYLQEDRDCVKVLGSSVHLSAATRTVVVDFSEEEYIGIDQC